MCEIDRENKRVEDGDEDHGDEDHGDDDHYADDDSNYEACRKHVLTLPAVFQTYQLENIAIVHKAESVKSRLPRKKIIPKFPEPPL